MKNVNISIIMFLIFLAGVVWLQIFLSKKRNKWPGLAIPIICFIFSLMSVLALPMFTMTSQSMIKTETSDGVIIEEKVQNENNIEKPSIGQMLAMTIPVFLVSNIPTIIFLAIYFACREKIKRNIELEKMNIQDLE